MEREKILAIYVRINIWISQFAANVETEKWFSGIDNCSKFKFLSDFRVWFKWRLSVRITLGVVMSGSSLNWTKVWTNEILNPPFSCNGIRRVFLTCEQHFKILGSFKLKSMNWNVRHTVKFLEILKAPLIAEYWKILLHINFHRFLHKIPHIILRTK